MKITKKSGVRSEGGGQGGCERRIEVIVGGGVQSGAKGCQVLTGWGSGGCE